MNYAILKIIRYKYKVNTQIVSLAAVTSKTHNPLNWQVMNAGISIIYAIWKIIKKI